MLSNFKKTMGIASLALLTSTAANAGTSAVDMHNVVITKTGVSVKASSGDCLYTSGKDHNGTKCSMANQEKNALHKIGMVFFGFNKAGLQKEALQKVHDTYREMSEYNNVKITLIGHTDYTGGEKYNMALSVKRADSVKKELVKLGIPSKEIKVEGKGYSEPLVPTAKGVREAKNRRVEMFYTLY